MIEKDIEEKICDAARDSGWLVLKLTSPSRRGAPDRMLIRDGDVVFLEIKTPKGRLSAPQVSCIKELRAHGATVGVVDSLKAAMEVLDKFNSPKSTRRNLKITY